MSFAILSGVHAAPPAQVKSHTKFEKILKAFCAKKAVNESDVRLVFDGNRLNLEDTPNDVDMSDGDVIDAFLEQLGGC